MSCAAESGRVTWAVGITELGATQFNVGFLVNPPGKGMVQHGCCWLPWWRWDEPWCRLGVDPEVGCKQMLFGPQLSKHAQTRVKANILQTVQSQICSVCACMKPFHVVKSMNRFASFSTCIESPTYRSCWGLVINPFYKSILTHFIYCHISIINNDHGTYIRSIYVLLALW